MKKFVYKTLLAISIALGIATSNYAAMVVVDPGNIAQSTISAMENVAQTAKQIEQYQTQLQQYEDQLKNSLAPANYIWDQASSTINKLVHATDTLNYYKQQLGNIDQYLAKFQDVNFYKKHPCFSNNNCSKADWDSLQKSQVLGSEAQKKANDALLRGLEQQQTNLRNDAHQLQRLQSQASGADGHMKALQAANQLASNQANQLLQIRGLLMAQQNVMAVKMQAEADLAAKQSAAHEAAIGGNRIPINLDANSKKWRFRDGVRD